jgi:trypsin
MTIRRRVSAPLALAAAGIAAVLTAIALPAAPAGAATATAEPQPLVIGGVPTTTDENPFMMQLTTDGTGPYCGGTLVAPTKVVTAAHCVTLWDLNGLVVVGGRTQTDSETTGTAREAIDVWIHPDYDGDANRNDIAVVTLADEMPYATLPYAGPDDTGLYTPGNTARVMGWGYTRETGGVPDQLMTAEVPVVSDADCEAAYVDYRVPMDPATMVCAGLLAEGGVDTCNRDSGGPLIVNGTLAGVVSWGNGCARPDYPGVYVRLTTFSELVSRQVNS